MHNTKMNCQLLKGRELVPIEKNPGLFFVQGPKLWKENEQVVVYVKEDQCLFHLETIIKLFDVDVVNALGKSKVKRITDFKSTASTKTYVKCMSLIHNVSEDAMLTRLVASKGYSGMYGREEIIPYLLTWALPEQVAKSINLFPVLRSEEEEEDELEQRLNAIEQRLQRIEALIEDDEQKEESN